MKINKENRCEYLLERLKARKSDLSRIITKTKEKIRNLDTLTDCLSDSNNISDEVNRIILNNKRLKSGRLDCDIDIGNYTKMAITRDYINYDKKWQILNEFITLEDPLALGMHKLIKQCGRDSTIVTLNCEIPRKLLARSMKEKEYNEYLNGIKPVSFYTDDSDKTEKFYIPSDLAKNEKYSSTGSFYNRIIQYFTQKKVPVEA